MKVVVRLLFSAVALSFLAVSAFAQTTLKPPLKKPYKYEGGITTTYEKDKDRTVVLIRLMPIKSVEDPRDILDPERSQDHMFFSMFFTYPGTTLATPKYVSIGITYMVLEPQQFKDHPLSAKIDGTWNDLGKMKVMLERQVVVQFAYKPYTRRFLELVVDYDWLLRFANAKKVKLKLGDYSFDLSSDQMEAIRDLASRSVP
jgi:hypothetical protein